MTLAATLAGTALGCSTAGLGILTYDWVAARQQTPGRHRAATGGPSGLSGTALLEQARADTDRLPRLPGPTRQQLRTSGPYR